MLRASDLTVRYGAISAVRGADVSLAAGTVTAVIGPNGAGKTSLFAGLVGAAPASGMVLLGDQRIDAEPTEARAAAGLVMVPAGRRVFGGLTVEQNLIVGATTLPRARTTPAVTATFERFPLLAERRAQRADTLSGGEAQLLLIARAMVADPRVLLVDEPFQGLSDEAAEVVLGTLHAAAQAGAAVAIASPIPVPDVDTIAIEHGRLEVRV